MGEKNHSALEVRGTNNNGRGQLSITFILKDRDKTDKTHSSVNCTKRKRLRKEEPSHDSQGEGEKKSYQSKSNIMW